MNTPPFAPQPNHSVKSGIRADGKSALPGPSAESFTRQLRRKLFVAAAAAVAAAAVYICWLPSPSEFKTKNPKTTAYIELRKKQALRAGKKLAPRQEWVRLDEISENLIHAAIIAEDETFYRHKGIDWEQMRIAVKINLKKLRFAYGGSTITQQTARNLYLSPSKNPLRKIKEMIIAKMLERQLGKRRILEIYLNIAEWGKGIFGVQAASLAYFGKPASALTPDESAALVSALPSPRRWNPVTSKYVARRKQTILRRMKASGYLPDEVERKLEQEEPAWTVETSTAPLPSPEPARSPLSEPAGS